MNRLRVFFVMGIFVAFCLVISGVAYSADKGKGKNVGVLKKGRTISMMVFPVGSSGYMQGAGLASTLRKKEGITLRTIPGGTELSRVAPVRAGDVEFVLSGGGLWMAFEGIIDFTSMEWGPQDIRLLWAPTPYIASVFFTRGDSGIKTLYDLKGKRVPYIVGSDSQNICHEAFLAFGNLTWKDVVQVKVSSFGAATKGVKAGTLDVAWIWSDGSDLVELASSPLGAVPLPMPRSDKAGWARFQKLYPIKFPTSATAGVGASPEKPFEGGVYPYPSTATYAKQDKALVYAMTKMIAENYDSYKGIVSGLLGWAPNRLNKQWALPYHSGAIKYFEEKGWWSKEDQKHQDYLLARAKILKTAFNKAVDEAVEKKMSHAKFPAFWLEKRNKAVEAFEKKNGPMVIKPWEPWNAK